MIIKTIKNLTLSTLLLILSACGGGGSASQDDESQFSGITSGGSNAEPSYTTPEIAAALAATSSSAPGITEGDMTLGYDNAQRFLTRATFGPTVESVEALTQSTPAAWLTEQMSTPPTYMSQRLNGENKRWGQYVNVWWKTAINGEDQLRQRIAFALSEIFVISAKDGLGDEQEGVANYYDILVDHAFGNFRDLMEAVTLNPMMGEYLSMKGNHKPDVEKNIRPDENFARELMQLFTIGLVMLNQDGSVQMDQDGIPLPTYDQDTIEAFAHVFTGWHFANVDDFRWPKNTDYLSPMQPYDDYHDKGSKVLLNGYVIPEGQAAEKDLQDALDNIFNHSNVAPFISKQLIQRLVTSNPSPRYVSDVANVFNDDGTGVRGSIASVVLAILLHEEALNGYKDFPNTFGKLKEPVLRVTSLWRAFMPDSIHYDFNYAWAAAELSQAPLNAPSVFNFFTPGFSLPGAIRDSAMVSPEFEIHDETSIINITNRLLSNSIWAHNYKYDSNSDRILINIDREVDMADDVDQFINHLDSILLGGIMSDGLRAEVITLMASRDYDWATSQKVVEAIFLVAASPEAAIQL